MRAASRSATRAPAARMEERVVDSGPVITGGGVTSGLDVSLHLVERFVGPEAATAAATRLEYARREVLVTQDG